MLDVIIIGGGAAGLFAAANLKTENALLLDHASEVGKKLLITGSGMCNLTNTLSTEDFLTHFGGKYQRNFLLPALQNFPSHRLCEWFSKRGLPTIVREDGKIFPQSLDAHDVRNLLLTHSKASIETRATIRAISKVESGFIVETDKTTYEAKHVLVATGGMSYPRTGSDGSGYELAKSLGHSIIPPKPALVAVSITEYPFKHLAGNSIRDASLSLYHEGSSSAYEQRQGDILFTHDGLSGPAILSASRQMRKNDLISLTMISSKNHHEAEQSVARRLVSSTKQVSTVLKESGMSASLAQTILNMANIAQDASTANLEKQKRKHLINLVGGMQLTISSTKGFQSAMVTSGGVNVSEVNRKSMESNITQGLFFCGEVLDYDGESGGYNLQSAFSTAYLAVQHIRI